MVPYLLCGDDVVVAICGDLFPHLLWHRFVPGKAELLVVDTQLDLPLFEGLLLGGEVVDIGVGQVVGLSESLLDEVGDDLTREVVELLIRVAHDTTVEDMVVVPAVVESDKPLLTKIGDLVRSRVDHPLDLVGPPYLPVHKEQVREYLNVINDRGIIVRLLIGLLMVAPRGERHLLHQLDAVVGLMRGLHGERENLLPHVRHVVVHPRLLGVRQHLHDEVDAGLRPGVEFLPQVPLYEFPDGLLVLHDLLTNQGFLLDGKISVLNRGKALVGGALGEASTEGGFTCVDLALDSGPHQP